MIDNNESLLIAMLKESIKQTKQALILVNESIERMQADIDKAKKTINDHKDYIDIRKDKLQ